MTTRRTFLQTAMLRVAAGTVPGPARGTALEAHQTTRTAGATPTIIDWHALERAQTELGLIGAVLPLDAFVTLAGARALAPVFAVAQKRRSHIFVHRGAAGSDIPGQHSEAGATNPYFGLPGPGGANAASAATPGDNVQARTLLITATHLATGVITIRAHRFP